jgi:hypothetical protein
MTTTMLQLVQQVTNELSVPTPVSVAGNTNADVVQILALMNAQGYQLLRKANWRQLSTVYQFTTSYVTTTGTYTTSAYTITDIPSTASLAVGYQVVGTGFPNITYITSIDSSTQVTVDQLSANAVTAGTIYFEKVKYSLPTDYDSITPTTQWDKSKHWSMIGPLDAQQWAYITSGFISTGPRVRWRLLGSTFQIWPGFSNAELLGFEYQSKAWARDANGTAKNSFTVDTDTCIYQDRLIVLATKLAYFEAKGFPTTALWRDYNTELETDIAQNTSSSNLSFAPEQSQLLIGWNNIPDTFPQ